MTIRLLTQTEQAARLHASAADLARALHLATVLQQSLEPERLIRVFFNELRPQLQLASLSWRCESQAVAVELGAPAECLLMYSFGEAELASDLSVSRASAFSDKEIEELEVAIGLLKPALRNALQYEAALASSRLDARTGLGNRLALEESLFKQLDAVRRHGQLLSLVVLQGERGAVGAFDLHSVARTLSHYSRRGDLLFRDGERFVILMPHTDAAAAEMAAARLQRVLLGMGGELPYFVSTAQAEASAGDTPAQLLRRALDALRRRRVTEAA